MGHVPNFEILVHLPWNDRKGFSLAKSLLPNAIVSSFKGIIFVMLSSLAKNLLIMLPVNIIT